MRSRFLNLTGLAACAALFAIAGCGDDDDDKAEDTGGSAPKAMELSASGSGKTIKITAPKSVPAGLTRITFRNSAKQPLALQLVRVEGQQSFAEVGKAGEAWGEKGKALPSWLRLEGGAPRATPGQTTTATQVLRPGKYYAFDIESNKAGAFEVKGGEPGGSLPEAPGGTITALDYEFKTSNLKTGNRRVLFENVGTEPHFMVAAPIKPGKTIADVRKFIKTEKGEEPIDEKGGVDTPVLDGGLRQVTELNFKKKGTYALLCFVPDRKGGPPHVAKGMISEATVR